MTYLENSEDFQKQKENFLRSLINKEISQENIPISDLTLELLYWIETFGHCIKFSPDPQKEVDLITNTIKSESIKKLMEILSKNPESTIITDFFIKQNTYKDAEDSIFDCDDDVSLFDEYLLKENTHKISQDESSSLTFEKLEKNYPWFSEITHFIKEFKKILEKTYYVEKKILFLYGETGIGKSHYVKSLNTLSEKFEYHEADTKSFKDLLKKEKNPNYENILIFDHIETLNKKNLKKLLSFIKNTKNHVILISSNKTLYESFLQNSILFSIPNPNTQDLQKIFPSLIKAIKNSYGLRRKIDTKSLFKESCLLLEQSGSLHPIRNLLEKTILQKNTEKVKEKYEFKQV